MRVFLLLLASLALGQQFDVAGDKGWIDTGIDVQTGDSLRLTASGTLQYANSKPSGPQGLARGWRDLVRILPLNDAGRGALIGRVGSADASRPFLIGELRESRVSSPGRLFLGINQSAGETPSGKYLVMVEHTRAAAAAPSDEILAKLPKLPQELIDKLPRRVVDATGLEGDRVNFLIIGSENRVRSALQAAGWVQVDRTVKDAVVRGALASFSKQAYVTLPMSELLMFGRPQDFGYAQGDPVRVVAARHHFRLWKAPLDTGGEPLWVGAGTHDVGFDKDQRNGKLTHKIDSDTDKERDYIGRTLFEAGQVVKLDYVAASNPVKEARTAHGQPFYSDGRTLLIYMRPDDTNLVSRFADLFCSVLRQNNPDGGQWEGCAGYIETPGREDLALAPLTGKYRVLVVPGIMSSCASDAPAFAEGREHLQKKYGITAQLLEVPNDSSEDNAARIAAFLRAERAKDPRKYIVVGYSKGTPDLQVALAKEAGVREAVAAFISVAGASGGSPIAGAMPAQAERWIRDFNFGKCQGDLSKGFRSLQQDVRRAFLSSFPHPFVPTYSLVAVSDLSNTSKALQKAWQLLSAFGSAHDGQLTRDDAIVPEAKYLGIAKSDHFALALPFDKVADGPVRAAMDRTRYPRAALLEALVRMAAADLE